MLVLHRDCGERIVFPDLGITIELIDVKTGGAQIGIEAPRDIAIFREEIAPDPGRTKSQRVYIEKLYHQRREAAARSRSVTQN